MNKKILFSALAVSCIGLAAGELPDLNIGDAAPGAEIALTDLAGNETSLNTQRGENGLLVIFSCNTCPFVIGKDGSEGWEGRYNEVGAECRKNKIGYVLVNSNEAKRDDGDDLEAMRSRNKAMHFNAKYLLDANSELANAFGARTTPHVFLFDKDMKLAYKGAIDDNVSSAKDVKEPWLKNAMAAMVVGEKIDPTTTRNVGCSIKRVRTAE